MRSIYILELYDVVFWFRFFVQKLEFMTHIINPTNQNKKTYHFQYHKKFQNCQKLH